MKFPDVGTRCKAARAARDRSNCGQGAAGQRGRNRNRFHGSGAIQCQPYPVRQSLKGARPETSAHRAGRIAKLRRTLCRSVALGAWIPVTGIAAWRSDSDVPRRYAGLSGRILRCCQGWLRAAADQHADAARSAAILPRGFERIGCDRRWRVLLAIRFDRVQRYATTNANRCKRSSEQSRCTKRRYRRAVAAKVPHRSCGGRHPSQRDGVLDVFIRLDGTAEGHRPSAARYGL